MAENIGFVCNRFAVLFKGLFSFVSPNVLRVSDNFNYVGEEQSSPLLVYLSVLDYLVSIHATTSDLTFILFPPQMMSVT